MSLLTRNDTVFCVAPFVRTPFLDLIEPVSAAGFTAISMTLLHYEELKAAGIGAAELGRRLENAGLRLAEVDAVWFPSEGRRCFLGPQVAKMAPWGTPERVIAVAAELGARSVTVIDVHTPALELDQAAEIFGRISDLAAQHGLLTNLEFIAAGGISNFDDAAEIVRRADRPDSGLTIDTLHFFRSGSSLESLGNISPDRIITVQLADAPAHAPADLAVELMQGRLTPGDGNLDLVGIMRVLDEIGAEAPIGVEVFSPDVEAQPIGVTAACWMRGLRNIMQRAGGRDPAGATPEPGSRESTVK